MAVTPSQKPEGNQALSAGRGARNSGTTGSNDPTTEPGQYPPGNWGTALFGGPIPASSAPGTAGASGGSDPTNEPGQTSDGLTGVSDAFITETGAPGTSTTPNGDGGSSSITYTLPGSYLSGTYQEDTYSDDLSGTRDSTQANDTGYATGGPQLPGIKGNEPVSGGKYQPGSGRVLRGGRSVRP